MVRRGAARRSARALRRPSPHRRGAVALCALTALSACGDSEGTGGSGGEAAGGTPGQGGAGMGGDPTVGSTGGAIDITGGMGAGGAPEPYVCDPPAASGSLYELFAESQSIEILEPVSMCEYRGDVL